MTHAMMPGLLSRSRMDGKSSGICPWGCGKFPEGEVDGAQCGHPVRHLQNAVGTHEKVSETGVMFAKLTEPRIGRHLNPDRQRGARHLVSPQQHPRLKRSVILPCTVSDLLRA